LIGSHVCEAFAQAGWQVRALDRPGSDLGPAVEAGAQAVYAELEGPDGALIAAEQARGAALVAHAAFPGAERAELARAISDQPSAFTPDPQRAVARRQQRVHAIVAKRRFVLTMEDAKPIAVEPHQPATGADPQVSVVRLRQSLREILRQPVGALPNALAILRRSHRGAQQKKCCNVSRPRSLTPIRSVRRSEPRP